MRISGANSDRFRQAGLLLMIAGICCGCGASRPVKYYELDPETATSNLSTSQFPITLLVSRVASSHLYRDDRLVYGINATELGIYEYQRWAASPVDMIQDALVEGLRASGQYRSVSAIGSNLRGEYILRTRLIALDEVDKPKLTARFVFETELYDTRAEATVWNDSYSHDEPVSGKKVSDVVEALDKNVRAGIQQVTHDLGQYFTVHPPQPTRAR